MALLLIVLFLIVGTATGELNLVQASEITGKIEKGEPIDYSNAKITGDINLNGLDIPNVGHITSPIKITDSIIFGSIDLNNTILDESVYLKRIKFMGPVVFTGTRFNETVNFDNSQFCDYANFLGSKLNGRSSFFYTKFNRSANFVGADFKGETEFTYSRFNGPADFKSSVFDDNVYFGAAVFTKPASFRDARFNSARFAGAQFRDDADFDTVQFYEPANFIGAKFDKRLYFNDVKFSRLSIAWDDIKDALISSGPSYLLLIKNFKDTEQFEDADNCYYQYRELKRQSKPIGKDNVLDYVAWLSCGYGVRWLNTILSAFLLLLLFSFYYQSWGIISLFRDFFLKKGIKQFSDNELKYRLKNSFYFSIVMLLSLPSEWFPAGKEEFAKLLKFHMFSAVLERLIGWALMLLLIGTLSRLMIRY